MCYTFTELIDIGLFEAAKIASKMTDVEKAYILSTITPHERCKIIESKNSNSLKLASERISKLLKNHAN